MGYLWHTQVWPINILPRQSRVKDGLAVFNVVMAVDLNLKSFCCWESPLKTTFAHDRRILVGEMLIGVTSVCGLGRLTFR